jgi:hypothetical protein
VKVAEIRQGREFQVEGDSHYSTRRGIGFSDARDNRTEKHATGSEKQRSHFSQIQANNLYVALLPHVYMSLECSNSLLSSPP